MRMAFFQADTLSRTDVERAHRDLIGGLFLQRIDFNGGVVSIDAMGCNPRIVPTC